MTTLDPRRLGDALRAGACGIHPHASGADLLIECGSWLHRDDFASRFITAGTSISDGVTLLASIDWEAAVTALHASELPASGGEWRVLLLASSIAGGTPVSLNDALPGIDRRNASLVVRAVAHAAGLPSGKRRGNSPRSAAGPATAVPSTSGFPQSEIEAQLSGEAEHPEPVMDISDWTVERLEAYAAAQHGQELERIRVVAQGHAYRAQEPRHVRLRWAKLALDANARLHGNGSSPWGPARTAQQNFMLRTWIIKNLGPGSAPDWDPGALAADTLAALTLDPGQASATAANWADLPPGQIGELRRHKNLTSHLATLVSYLQPGPARDQVADWIEVRELLP